MSDLTPEQAFKRRIVAAIMDNQGNVVATCTAVEALIEEARREELAECGRVLFGLANEFDTLADGQVGHQIIYGALTDQSCFVRNVATTLGCVEVPAAALRARGKGTG